MYPHKIAKVIIITSLIFTNKKVYVILTGERAFAPLCYSKNTLSSILSSNPEMTDVRICTATAFQSVFFFFLLLPFMSLTSLQYILYHRVNHMSTFYCKKFDFFTIYAAIFNTVLFFCINSLIWSYPQPQSTKPLTRHSIDCIALNCSSGR